ncbi:MAG: NAD(P)H-binding protein [Limosilactobacillus sp.]|uniref:NAD(P)H-binding protein n=1 Tax=Limosilactobacillus sp. TaxID=2773925 RepID=UPI0023BDE88B|nr:NAD(P)H-binding protein [Limosilactobacillus sp.]MDE7039473.1 NAD(P)H-binding protein [Limosilactobacillus sp.]
MTKVLIIGATSKVALNTIEMLTKKDNVDLTLVLRNKKKLPRKYLNQKIIIADAVDYDAILAAVKGQNIVYASLAGDVVAQAKTIVKAMDGAKVKRLIWTSSTGIYNEIPGELGRWNQVVLGDYYHHYFLAANVIEKSDLDYTILRPTWMTNDNEINYETTHRHDPATGTEVSRKSIAAYVTSLIENPTKDIRDSIGINKPNTQGDRPRDEVMKLNHFYDMKDC